MPSPLEHVKLRLVTSIDDLWAMKAWASERRETPLGVDTESSGLSHKKDVLRVIQLGDKNYGWAVPFHLWGGGAMELLNAYEGDLVAHNSPHDVKFLTEHAGWKVPWARLKDTMSMAHIVNPLRPKGLKALANRLVDPRASSGEQALSDGMKKQGWTWGTVPLDFPPYWIYSALDPVLTCHIWDKLQPEIVAGGYEQVYDFELAVNRVITNMMIRGMLVDVPYITAKLESIRSFGSETREWLKAEFGITSPMSATQIANAIQSEGQQIAWYTEHGHPQMDKAALAYYQQNAVTERVRLLCQYVLAIRHSEKMAGTYLENLLKLRDTDDVIHAAIWSLGARTGRMSITDPALQTLPRDDLIVRGAFVPRDGYVFISIDASQIEARLAAHFSNDQGLINAFKEADGGGTDFFCSIASGIFQEEIKKSDPRRQLTKNTVYGSLYGAGAAKMAITAGVPLEVMAPVKQGFDQRYPGLKMLTNEVITRAMQTSPPSVRTPLGRRLVADQGREYTQLVNALIQGHAAEILKRGLIDLDSSGFGDNLLLPVHDEVVLEVPEGQAEEALRTVSEVLTNRTDYKVDLTWSGVIMRERWGGTKG